MLVEFTVANFRSIKTAQTFSLVKGKGNELEQSNTFQPLGTGNPALLRSAAIYGSNAAGKSNFIKALQAMERVVADSATKVQRGDELPVSPFRLDVGTEKAPTEFEVVFIVDGTRFQYGFTATRTQVLEEWLLAFPKGPPQRWFSRAWDEGRQHYNWKMGKALSGQKQLWQESTRPNALFLSTAVQLNSEQLQPVYDWFKYTLRTAQLGGWGPAFTASLCDSPESQERVLDFLKAADLDVYDVQVTKEKFDIHSLPDNMPDAYKQQLAKELKDKEVIEIKTVHQAADGRTVMFEFDEESDGTQKLFSFAGPWLDSLENGYVLFIDELHDNLHPKLVRFLVELFHNPDTNPNNAQLVFTTHETSILSQEVFRRDQVWFCEKDEGQATELIPLADFKPRKNRENLEMSYLAGRYGALPYIRKLKTATA